MNKFLIALAVVSTGLLLVGAGCQYQEPGTALEDVLDVTEGGVTRFNQGALHSQLDSILIADLTDAEKEGLAFMREEERLAHDVYMYLYEKWGNQIFQNIANSEQTHTDAVYNLLTRYELSDPSEGFVMGQFSDPILQALYDQLIEQGNISEVEALKVGATVEEVDILDLEKYLAEGVSEDIAIVYNNLLRGSRNHLRAFVRNIEQVSAPYEGAGYLGEDVYQEILAGDVERGGVSSDRMKGSHGNGQGNGRNRQ